MKCKDIEQLQHAFLDQELDPANAHAFAEHLAACPSCGKQLDAFLATKQAIKTQTTRHALPFELYKKVARMTASGQTTWASPSKKWLPLKWGTTGAGLAMAACLAFFMVARPDSEYMLEQQLIAGHIRSLQDNHLTDVVSTDQHTVKPWFNGRLDISPPVIDLTASGFPLVGGRLDYVDHHAAAAVVYRYNAHVINLFVWPSDRPKIDVESIAARQGYNMRRWRDGDLQFWAVSDVNPAKLAEFENLYRAQTPKTK
jgi:anti-sigma factor (TIGR02949 family)